MARTSTATSEKTTKQDGSRIRKSTSAASRKRASPSAATCRLRAKTVALLHESVEYSQRADEYHRWYQPESPAACHYVNECTRSSLLADRVENFRQSELEAQTHQEARRWLKKQKRRVRYLAGKLNTRPDQAAAQLREFGQGVAFLIQWHDDSIVEVQSQGCLSPEWLDGVFEVSGCRPGPASVRENPLVYLIHLYNLGCTPGVSPLEIATWLAPSNRPEALRDMPLDHLRAADADHFRGLLVALLQNERDQLLELAKRVDLEVDQPSFRRALNRVSILSDAAARRLAPDRADARLTFPRAFKELIATLERDREKGPPDLPNDDDDSNDHDQDEDRRSADDLTPEASAAATAEVPTADDLASDLGPAMRDQTAPCQREGEGDSLPGDTPIATADADQSVDEITTYATSTAELWGCAKRAQNAAQDPAMASKTVTIPVPIADAPTPAPEPATPAAVEGVQGLGSDEPSRDQGHEIKKPGSAGCPKGSLFPESLEIAAAPLERIPDFAVTYVEPTASIPGCAKRAQNAAQPPAMASAKVAVRPPHGPSG
jgi:hypothetical protein